VKKTGLRDGRNASGGFSDAVSVTFETAFGAHETDGLDTCLHRALQRLAESGKPPGDLVVLGFFHPGIRPRFLGVIAATPGRRLLFFPGFSASSITGYSNGGTEDDGVHHGFHLHHVTLEPENGHCHITGWPIGEPKRYVPYRIDHVSPGIRYWFGLSLRVPLDLEEIRRQTTVVIPCARSQSKRIESELSAAMEQDPQIIELPSQQALSINEFLHFDFLLLDPRLRLSNNSSAWNRYPRSPSLVIPAGPIEPLLELRRHRLQIPRLALHLAIVSSRHPARLRQRHFITGGRRGQIFHVKTSRRPF